MKKRPISDESLNRIIKYLVITLLGLAIIFIAIQFGSFWSWILGAIRSVIVPIGLAYLTALIVFPIVKYLEKKGVGPRFFSLGIVFILTAALIFAGFKYLGPRISEQITNFFNRDFQTIIVYFQTDLRDDFIFGTQLYDQIANYIADTDIINTTLNQMIPNLISSLTSSLIPLLATILLLPILLIFYLLDYEMITERIRSIIPAKHEKDYAELGNRLNNTVGAYLRGQLSLMIVLGFVAVIAYRLIGLKYYLIFGVLVGLTNIIPYFGMIIAALPPTIYAMISGTAPGPILVLALNAGLQFIEGNFLQPYIMGKNMSLHPIVIIMSILFWGSLFGAIGVILASPITASIREFYLFIRQRRKAEKQTIPTEVDTS